jgi:fucose permease
MSAVPAATARSSVATSILIIGVLFFLIGFFTWLNGPLITFV